MAQLPNPRPGRPASGSPPRLDHRCDPANFVAAARRISRRRTGLRADDFRDNTVALKASIETRNAAVAALELEGEAGVVVGRKATQNPRAVAESCRRAAGVLRGKPASADRYEAAAIHIAETIR